MLRSLPPSADGAALPEGCHWVDLVDPSEQEIALVKQRFGVEPQTLDELERIEATSRLSADGDTLRMSAPLISGTETDRWALAPVGFILTPNVCISVRFAKLEAFETVARELAAKANVTPPEVLTRLLEEIVDRAADHLERASVDVNDASHSVFFEEPKRRQLSKNTALMRDAMRKIGRVSDRTWRVRYTFLSVGRIAAFVMDRCRPKIDAELHERLEAVRHDIASLDEFESSLSSRVQLLQDAAAGFISIEQNDVVKLLTVVSVVGVPPVLVVGIYGMNFKNMPELNWQYGYPYALALCVITTILPLIWFKWRDWI